MNELVCIKRNEPVADSLQIAEMFGKRHDRVLRAIDNTIKTLPKNGERSNGNLMFIPSKKKMADGQMHRMYYMNRDGFSLVVMGFTGSKAMEWKLKYIEAFNRMEEIIRDPERMTARIEGKTTRRTLTDQIQRMQQRAEELGSKHAQHYYHSITKLCNDAAGVTDRAIADRKSLNRLQTVEEIIADLIGADLDANVDYHDIYQHCKTKAKALQQAFA